MSRALLIRPAVLADAEAISGVIVDAVRISNASDYPRAVIERVAAGFAPEFVAAMIVARRTLVAIGDNDIVGTGALDGSAVRSVFVRPAFQGRGIGAALIAAIFRCARKEGVTELRLQSSLGARGFYIRLGFEVIREADWGGERTIVMRRSFGPAMPACEDARG